MGPAAVKEALTASSGTRYANLILSKVFLERHIIHADLDEKTQSVRFRALLKRLMIRRTLASAIPFKSGRIIGKDIPPAVRKVFNTEFNPEEQEAYKTYWIKNRRVMVLDQSDRENPRYRWAMARFRRLVLGASWLGMILLEPTLLEADFPKAVNLQKRRKLVPRWIQYLQEQKQVE
ncbi:hypothetical protein BO71DRAFT_354832, partial [Aspergillus ellipticus CBS 707.79]